MYCSVHTNVMQFRACSGKHEVQLSAVGVVWI